MRKVLYLVLLLFPLNLLAQEIEIPKLDQAAVLKSAAAVTSEIYPDADDVLIDDYTRVQYKADGTAVELCDSYQKILTEKGKRQNNEIVLDFSIPYDKVAVLSLEVIKADGRIVPIDVATHSKEMISADQMGSNIYNPNDKELRVGIPDLQIGDIVHSVTRNETVKPVVPNTFSSIVLFEYTSPIKHHIYEVIAPAELPLKKMVIRDEIKGTVKVSEEKTTNGTLHRWEVSNVPQMFPEPDMPNLSAVVQRLLISTVENWEDISKWYWKISEPHLGVITDEMKQKVADITNGISDPRKKLEAVFRWVSQEIRYLGITIEKDAPGFEPHDVKLTFEQRHGVCRDKAALLVAMLRLAGFKAYPVLIYVGPKRDPQVPMSRFNHAIVAAELAKDNSGEVETILMDPTNESTKDLLPAYLSDRSYIIAKENGAQLDVAPIVPARENELNISTNAKINQEGRLVAESEIIFNGINDSAYRGLFARATAEERELFFSGIVKSISAGAELLSVAITPTNLMDTKEVLKAKVKYAADQALVEQNGYAMFTPPYFGTRVGMVNFVLGKTGLEKRKYPLNIEIACGVNENLILEVDPIWGRLTDTTLVQDINNEYLTWNGSLQENDNGQLSFNRKFSLNVVEFSPEQYLRLKQDLKSMEYDKRKKLVFARDAKSWGDADVALLGREVKINIKDEHTWTEEHYYKKQVLTYKGKKDVAEVKIGYNTSLENVKVLEALVTNGKQVKKVADNEINLMDAAWVASAPRYPASKTLVLSLPSVEIGSIVEYKLLIEKKESPFFSTLQIFRDFEPLQSKKVIIDAPADMPLTVIADGNGTNVADDDDSEKIFKHSEIIKAGRKILTWEVGSQVPFRRENSMPAIFTIAPTLYVASANWKTYINSVYQALIQAAENQTGCINKAQILTKDITDSDQKIIAIRNFVAKNIKPVGPSFNSLALSAITPADQTLDDGYGNMTDRAVVLYAMLRGIGLPAEFVLFDSDLQAIPIFDFRKKYPLSSTFDGILIRVNDGSEDIILNDTNQYAKLGTTSAEGCLTLNKQAVINPLHLTKDLRSDIHVKLNLKVKADGKASLNVEKTYFGMQYASEKQLFSEMTPEMRRRYFQEQIASISQSAKAASDLVTDFDSYPGKESYSVDIDSFAVISQNDLYFDLPRSIGGLSGIKSSVRYNPFAQVGYNKLRIETVIDLPREYPLVRIMPKSGKWLLPNHSGKIISDVEYNVEKYQLNIQQRVNYKPAIFSAEEYQELVLIEKALSHPSSRGILLSK